MWACATCGETLKELPLCHGISMDDVAWVAHQILHGGGGKETV
mgnify:CR=1 FL=1